MQVTLQVTLQVTWQVTWQVTSEMRTPSQPHPEVGALQVTMQVTSEMCTPSKPQRSFLDFYHLTIFSNTMNSESTLLRKQ